MLFVLGLLTPGGSEAASRPRSRSRRQSTDRETLAAPATPKLAAPGSSLVVQLTAVTSGLAISSAWLVPETAASALLGWIGSLLLIYTVRARRAYLPAYGCGLVVNTVGFYWIYRTVSVFGGYGALASALIFAGFVLWGALLFLVFAFIHHNLGPFVDRLRAAVSDRDRRGRAGLDSPVSLALRAHADRVHAIRSACRHRGCDARHLRHVLVCRGRGPADRVS